MSREPDNGLSMTYVTKAGHGRPGAGRADIHWPRVLGDLPVQVGELEDLRDERVGDLQRGLRLAVDAELHGAAGSRALRDRERRAAGPGEERQLDPVAGGGGQEAAGPIVDSWRLSTSAASRRTTARSVIVTGAGG